MCDLYQKNIKKDEGKTTTIAQKQGKKRAKIAGRKKEMWAADDVDKEMQSASNGL